MARATTGAVLTAALATASAQPGSAQDAIAAAPAGDALALPSVDVQATAWRSWQRCRRRRSRARAS